MHTNTHHSKTKYLFLAAVIALVIVPIGITALLTFPSNTKPQTTDDVEQAVESKKNSQPPAAPQYSAKVTVTDKGFEPAVLSVASDTEVTWVNEDTGLHQIVSNTYSPQSKAPTLQSSILNLAQTYQFTFKQTGTYNYHDKLNPTVNGTIQVQ